MCGLAGRGVTLGQSLRLTNVISSTSRCLLLADQEWELSADSVAMPLLYHHRL